MTQQFSQWKKKLTDLIKSPYYIIELLLTITLLYLSIAWQNNISQYNDSMGIYSGVGDILFAYIPAIDLSYLYFGGIWITVIIGFLYFLIKTPKRIPFIIFSIALFFFIRSICITSTNIGIPPDHIIPNIEGFIGNFHFFRNDLFFSGHTGFPFLIALLAWKDVFFRNIFIFISIIMAFTVVSMRLHYTIDIIGAYFITYGIFKISTLYYSKISSFFRKYHNDTKRNNPPKNTNI